ncbi:MAG: trimethylamine methyltransferase family protein [Candidatus Thorarchaeota archaeon]
MYRLLGRGEISAVHSAAMEVLERVGIVIQHDAALKKLADAGATVDDKTKVVKIPEYLIHDALQKSPRRHKLVARNPKYNIVIGDGASYFTNAFGAHYTIDLETGERRLSTIKDLEEFTLLADYFPTVDYIKPNILPQDVPKTVWEQEMALAMFKSAEKHLSLVALTPEGWRDVIEMAKIYVGGEDEFIKNPSIIDTGFNNVPPLKYTPEIIDMVLECAKYGIPFDISTGLLSSASGPVTLAGSIVQGIAENHAIVVLTQLIGPGTPIMWGSCATILDQRFGTAAYGSPENGLIHAAFCQMAHYYGLPYYGAAGVIDSKVPDQQAAYENTMNALLATVSGADVVHDAVYGIVEAGVTASYEMFAISNDICGAIKRISKGIQVTPETLAVDLIETVGHEKNHLNTPEALRFTKKHLLEEQWQPLISNRTSRPEWEKRGSKTIHDVAKEKVKEILQTHTIEPLDKKMESAMRNLIKARIKKTKSN